MGDSCIGFLLVRSAKRWYDWLCGFKLESSSREVHPPDERPSRRARTPHPGYDLIVSRCRFRGVHFELRGTPGFAALLI